jgi:predicted DNA-binding protein (MmcQ/YjbR family)
MIKEETFTEMALSFAGIEQTVHFERTGFKVIGKRMFATYLQKDNTANIFLTPEEQAIFGQIDSENIYPVPNKWGEKGATTFELNQVAKELVMEALLSAYNEVVKSRERRLKRSITAPHNKR